MSSWIVVPCLLKAREEFNQVSPNRDKGADGTISDSNHTSLSDHTPDEDSSYLANKDSDRRNEVHALDIDSDGPWPGGDGREAGGWFDRKVHQLIAEEKRRWKDPDDVCRVEYFIWRGKIYSRAYDFVARDYSGVDGHYDHLHISARYLTAAENDTRPWGIYEEDTLSAAEVNEIKSAINSAVSALRAEINAVKTEVWTIKVGSKAVPNRTALAALKDLSDERSVLRFPATHAEAKAAGYPADSPLVSLLRAAERIDDIEAKLDALAVKPAKS